MLLAQVHDNNEISKVQTQCEKRDAHDLFGVADTYHNVRAHNSGVALHRTPRVNESIDQGLQRDP